MIIYLIIVYLIKIISLKIQKPEMSLPEELAIQDIGAAEKSLKHLTHRDQSPKIFSKYPKFNERLEDKAREEVHR